MKKKNKNHSSDPPLNLWLLWQIAPTQASHFISEKGSLSAIFFNASRLSAQIDSSKKIKSSAINVCDICALCVFVHLGAIDACDDCVSV